MRRKCGSHMVVVLALAFSIYGGTEEAQATHDPCQAFSHIFSENIGYLNLPYRVYGNSASVSLYNLSDPLSSCAVGVNQWIISTHVNIRNFFAPDQTFFEVILIYRKSTSSSYSLTIAVEGDNDYDAGDPLELFEQYSPTDIGCPSLTPESGQFVQLRAYQYLSVWFGQVYCQGSWHTLPDHLALTNPIAGGYAMTETESFGFILGSGARRLADKSDVHLSPLKASIDLTFSGWTGAKCRRNETQGDEVHWRAISNGIVLPQLFNTSGYSCTTPLEAS